MTYLLRRLVLDVHVDITPLPGDPRSSVHLRRERDLAVASHEEGFRAGHEERPEGRSEDDGRAEIGEDLDVAVEVGDGPIASVL